MPEVHAEAGVPQGTCPTRTIGELASLASLPVIGAWVKLAMVDRIPTRTCPITGMGNYAVRPLTVGIMLSCLGLCGCASIKEKFGGGSQPKGGEVPPPVWVKPPKGNGKRSPTAALPSANVQGVIAGQVIDPFNQRRPNAILQVSATDPSPGEEAIDASANQDGYFMIEGLEPGRRYKLLAWAQKGDQPLGGTTIATAPNVQVVIKVSEQFATTNPPTSKLEPGGRLPKKKQPPTYLNDPDRSERDRDQDAGGQSEQPGPRQATPFRPENVTLEPKLARDNPPVVELPPSPSARGPALGSPQVGVAASCSLNGNRLEDFALRDLAGKPYHFRDRAAKVTLLDFWGTWCPSCIQGMPQLAELHRQYASRGFEVIGIAYEDGKFKERADRVNFVARRQGAAYRMLLGEGENCPVLTKLNVQTFPTLILVDEQGNMIWRGEGLTPQNKSRLLSELTKRLGPPE